MLRQYDAIVPGLAAQIVEQAKAQTNHRIAIEARVIESDISRSRLGLFCGFALSVLCIGGGIACVLMGHDTAGAAIATGAVIGLASTFIYGTALRKAERTEKSKIMTGREP
ncbi:MAG: DUF2335 domain-containing protein [Pirellulales bacterium]|nr:DUF2335 domain-containing protein [Pirellulales bacterium]